MDMNKEIVQQIINDVYPKIVKHYGKHISYERKEDEGNGLWEVYNRVQESLVQGKYQYLGGNKKFRKARPIKNFKQSIHVNQKLSELAFAYV